MHLLYVCCLTLLAFWKSKPNCPELKKRPFLYVSLSNKPFTVTLIIVSICLLHRVFSRWSSLAFCRSVWASRSSGANAVFVFPFGTGSKFRCQSAPPLLCGGVQRTPAFPDAPQVPQVSVGNTLLYTELWWADRTINVKCLLFGVSVRSLLILDDVWDTSALRSFDVQCRVLLTTRNRSLTDSVSGKKFTFTMSISGHLITGGRHSNHILSHITCELHLPTELKDLLALFLPCSITEIYVVVNVVLFLLKSNYPCSHRRMYSRRTSRRCQQPSASTDHLWWDHLNRMLIAGVNGPCVSDSN